MDWSTYLDDASDDVEPPVSPLGHTMKPETFMRYCESKVHVKGWEILRRVAGAGQIAVHGVPIEALETLLAAKGLKEIQRSSRTKDDERAGRPSKMFNCVRPVVCECIANDGARHAIVQCNPSREFVLQTAEVIASFLHISNAPDCSVHRHHYRTIESDLPDIYRFNELFDLVDVTGRYIVMGDVDEIHRILSGNRGKLHTYPWHFFGAGERFGFAEVKDQSDEPLFILLGVKETFWGSFASQLAAVLAIHRAGHIIYVAKGAAISDPNAVRQVFHPTEYTIADYDEHDRDAYIIHDIHNPPASGLQDIPLLTMIGERPLRSSRHLSVPTVVGQTQQRMEPHTVNKTLDIEISRIARALGDINRDCGLSCGFSALHMITDSLNPSSRTEVEDLSDLTVHDPTYYERKREMLFEITRSLTIWSALTAEKRKLVGELWRASDKNIDHLMSRWEEMYILITKCLDWNLDIPRVAITTLLMKCRFAPFYALGASGFELLRRNSDKLRKVAPTAYVALKYLGHYYDPTRDRKEGTTQFEEETLPRLLEEYERLPSNEPYSKFAAASFYAQLASHIVEADEQQSVGKAVQLGQEAEVLLDSCRRNLLSEIDYEFESLHLSRNIVRLKPRAQRVTGFKRLVKRWESYIKKIDYPSASEFIRVCQIHARMCEFECGKAAEDAGLMNAAREAMEKSLSTFRRGSPLTYWADTRLRLPKDKGAPRHST